VSIDKPVTIRDIAALAGVSAGTVSRVMNGMPGVGASTRERISALIAEHDFRGDSNARQLSRGRSDSIGVVFPLQVSEVVMHPVYPELLGAISDAALTAGYDVSLFTTTGQEGVEHIVDAFKRKRVDGLVLPAASGDDPLIQRVIEEGIPTVLVGHRQESARMSWVDCTHDDAIFEITSAMLAAGKRRLTLLNGHRRVSAYQLRSEGFWRAIGGRDDVEARELELGMSYPAGRQAGLELSDDDRRSAGIVCSADSTAAGVLEQLGKTGTAIPTDLEISGFDDTDFASHSTPPLTSVRMPLRETGEAAVALLRDLVEDPAVRAEPRLLPATVVRRSTTS
jgi:LacI family transcriptional regulator